MNLRRRDRGRDWREGRNDVSTFCLKLKIFFKMSTNVYFMATFSPTSIRTNLLLSRKQ